MGFCYLIINEIMPDTQIYFFEPVAEILEVQRKSWSFDII